MVSQTIWIVDTQQRSQALAESITSPQVEVISVQATNRLAQSISSRANGAVIANIHENEDFETLEHLSKISLTFPEIPLVLLLPEPLHASIDWGPRVFNLIKPVSPESILKRLSFLDEHSYPTRGILQRGYLLALLDHCLLQKKHVRIVIHYVSHHTCELLIQNGKLISLYIDNSLKNDKVLFPFALDGAEFSMEHLPEQEETGLTEGRFAIGEDEYRRFRLELHPFLSLMQQFPPMSEILRIDDARLVKVLNSLPEQVHSVIRHFDGKNDLFQIFLESDLRPLETAQRIGYLYFSDVFESTHPVTGSSFGDEASTPAGSPSVPMRERSSSELAGWLLNPVAAARELEEKIKKNLKARKKNDTQFRPHRKTQPGLGGLLRPVLEEDSEDEATKSNWGGVNVRLLRESQEMLLKMSGGDEAVPGMPEQVLDFSEEVDEENAEASGVIDVAAVDNPVQDAAPKIILDSAPVLSGESVVAPEAQTFHDEPTMPLEQFDEVSENAASEGVSQDSLLELLELRSEERVGTVPMRMVDSAAVPVHRTREMPAVHVDDDGHVLLDDDKTPDPGSKVTPVPNFEEEPNSSVTPRPEISVDDPTPVPGEQVPQLRLPKPEAEMEGDAKEIPTVTGAGSVVTFQKETVGSSSKWKYFIVVALIAGLGIWFVFRPGADDEMKPGDPGQNPPTDLQPNAVAHDGPTEPPMQPEPEMAMEPAMAEPPVDPMPSTDATPTTDATAVAPDAPMTPVPPAAGSAELVAKAEKLHDDYVRKETRSALTELEKLAVDHPDLAPVAAYLSDIYYLKGRIPKAKEFAQKATQLDAESALAWWVIGLIAYEDGKKAVYVEAFRNYLRLSPNDQKAKSIRQLKIRELSGP